MVADRLGGDARFAHPEAGSCLHGAQVTFASTFAVAVEPTALGGSEHCLECAYREAVAIFGAQTPLLISPTPTGARVTINGTSASGESPAAALRELIEIVAGA